MNKKLGKKLLLIALLATILNFSWEILHSRLYSFAYIPNSPVTLWSLLFSTIGDVIYTLVVAIVFIKVLPLRNQLWTAIVIGVIFTIFWENLALNIGAWQYNSLMPIIPLINTGLTPTIQLGLLSYITFKIVDLENISRKGRT